MSGSLAPVVFAPEQGPDPALPGDPFARTRYTDGQLLGAEDFAQEQRYHLLRARLRNALLHGMGTVWGLAVSSRDTTDPPGSQLIVEPGIAIDALGREVFVPRRVCLDVTGLDAAPLWADLAEDEGIRRAFVVLSYRAALADPVPAIAPPCGDARDAEAYARILDSYRICLEAAAPADPHELHRDWTARTTPADLRARLLAHITSSPVDLGRFWGLAEDAGLLLATVEFEMLGETVHVLSVDNAVRALLPAVQDIAETVFATRLNGAGGAASFRVESVEAAQDDTATVVAVTLSAPPDPVSVTDTSARLLRFDAGAGWVAETPTVSVDGSRILLRVDPGWTAETTYQVVLETGAGPVLSEDGAPLAPPASPVARFTPPV